MKSNLKIRVCQCALSVLFDKEQPSYIKTTMFGVHIFGDSENQDACKIVGNTIKWRVWKSPLIIGHGRWRTHEKDERLGFVIENDKIVIYMYDGSKITEKEFKI